jgi:hypothetical protein
LGVTAYQLADMARTTTVAAVRGHRKVSRIAKALEKALTSVWGTEKDMRTYASEVARQTARGTMHAKENADLDVGHLAHSSVLGIARTFGRARIVPQDALRGAGYGVVQGAGETGADLGKATINAVEAAREVAEQAGLSEEEAVAYVAQGALDAAVAMGGQAVAQVKACLPEDVLPADLAEQEK